MQRMITVTVLVLALALGALPAAAQSPPAEAPLHRATGEAVEGSYIVKLTAGRAASAVARDVGVRPEHVYEHALAGFAARLDARELERVRRHPQVEFVEEDQVAEAYGVQYYPPWNLDRIDQRYRPLDGRYTWNRDGTGVFVYVFDTGIQTGHPEFGRRAFVAYDAFGGNGQDCNGHGTHVAGTVGAKTYGVAKGARLGSVRVLDCNGSGTYSGIINAIDYIRVHHRKPAVANFSLGGGASSALNSAVNSLANAGVFVAVAAGSSGGDACHYSPAGAANAYTIGASTPDDAVAPYSNQGPCLDIFAPGAYITSTWIGGGTRTLNGTSVAAPHTTGVAALYKSYGDASSAAVAHWLTTNATRGVLSGVRPDTVNLLLYKADL